MFRRTFLISILRVFLRMKTCSNVVRPKQEKWVSVKSWNFKKHYEGKAKGCPGEMFRQETALVADTTTGCDEKDISDLIPSQVCRNSNSDGARLKAEECLGQARKLFL